MKIAIVNDLAIARDVLARVIHTMDDCELVWQAENGLSALEKQTASPVDLIIMDIHMPVMDGVSATRLIMKEKPCSILIVTSSVSENVSPVFDAMGAGAIDAASTPGFRSDGTIEGADIIAKKIRTIRKIIAKHDSHPAGTTTVERPVSSQSETETLIVIGASTGGPRALVELISALPHPFPASIVIVQHIDAQFAPGMIEWLDKQTTIPVHMAHYGHRPKQGTVAVAPTDKHLGLDEQGQFTPVLDATRAFVPAIDVLFESTAQHWKKPGIGILLTGMGRDGAEGLLRLREAGWHTIAQDEETSVVYGMPKAAAQRNAAKEILPLQDIAESILTHVGIPVHQT